MQAAGGAAVTRTKAALLAAAIIAADQITKSAIVAALDQGESRPLIGDVLQLTHLRNTGAAFGTLRGFGGILGLAALVGIIAFAAVIVRRPPPLTTLGAALVAAGASGNLLDRLFRDGGVVDFVDFRFWPAFNVADSAITIGALVLLYAGMKEGSERKTEDDAPAAQGS